MTQIDHQRATSANAFPLGSGKTPGTPAGDGTFLAFMGQTPLPAPHPPLATTAPTPANAARLAPDLLKPDLLKPDPTNSPVPVDTQHSPLPFSDEPLPPAPQSDPDQPDLADNLTATPSQNMLTPAPSTLAPPQSQAKPADSPTVRPRPDAAASPAGPSALPDPIAPRTVLQTQPTKHVGPAAAAIAIATATATANAVHPDVQSLPNTDQSANPLRQTSPLDKAKPSLANQPPAAVAIPVTVAGPMVPNRLPTTSPDTPALSQTAPAAPPIAVQNVAPAAVPLPNLASVAQSTDSPEHPTQPMPTHPLAPPKPITNPRALAFAGALSAYKATESPPSPAIVQTPVAPIPQAALLPPSSAARQTPPQAGLITPFPSARGGVAIAPQLLPARAALAAISVPTPPQTGPDSDAQQITSLSQPTVKEPQPPPNTPTPAAPPIPTTTLQTPVPMPALVQHIRQHAAPGKPTASELSLAPEELGKLRILMTPDGDKLRIVIQAERPETLELLRRNSDSFTADLRQSGFAGASFSFGGWGDQPPAQQAKNQDTAALPFGLNGEIAAPSKPYARSPKTSGLDLRV